ncbi:MAG: hypothetical protein WC760_05710 [Bacteroidia bacterium]|jgi:hypothetical protein
MRKWIQSAFNSPASLRIYMFGLFMFCVSSSQAQVNAKVVEKEKAVEIVGFDFGSKFVSIRTGGYDPGLPERNSVTIIQNALNYGIARKKHQWIFALKTGIGNSSRRRSGINLSIIEWGPSLGYARIIKLFPFYHVVPSFQLGLVGRSISLSVDSTVQMRTRFSDFSSVHLHIEPGIYFSMPRSKNWKRPVRSSVYMGYSHDFSSRSFDVGGRRPRTAYASTAASGFIITWNVQVFIP